MAATLCSAAAGALLPAHCPASPIPSQSRRLLQAQPLTPAHHSLRAHLALSRPAARRHSIATSASASGQTTATGGYAALETVPQVPFVDPASGSPSAFPAASGVYAIYDKDGVLQYMGLSRRLNASLAIHLQELPELCGAVKLVTVSSPERSVLVEAWKQWMEEHVAASGGPPPGNASGNATWTTRKARPNKPEIRLTPGKHVQLNVPLIELIDKVVKENKVVAFIKGTRTAPECGFSHRVLTLLNEARADYEVLNVLDEDHNPGLRDAIKEYSQWPTIPQVYVKGEFLGGADILSEMAEAGQLKEALTN